MNIETNEQEGLEDQIDEQSPAEELDAETEAAQLQAQEDAKKYGWRPKEDFDRNPDGWVDAERFLELPSTHLKMTRDINKSLQAQLDEVKQSNSRIEATTRVAIERVRDQERREYEQKMQEIQAQQREAVSMADSDKYDSLEQRKRSLAPPSDPMPQANQGPDPAVQDYIEKNEWAKNPAIWAEAVNAVNFMPNNTGDARAQLEYAESVMKNKYPHMFQSKAPARSRVDSGGLALGGGSRRGKGGSDLPADARAIGASFVEDGIFKDLDDYASSYFAQEAGQ